MLLLLLLPWLASCVSCSFARGGRRGLRRGQGEVDNRDRLMEGIDELKVLLGACSRRIAMHAMGKTDACSEGTVVVVDEESGSDSLRCLDLVNDVRGHSRPPRCLLARPLT